MSLEQATFWLDVIGALVAVAWIAGAWFVWRTGQVLAESRTGSADVDRDPATALQRLAREVAGARPGSPLMRATIESATDRELRWTTSGPFAHRGTARATGTGNRSRIEWEIAGKGRGLLLGARAVVVLGAAVAGVLYSALQTHAAASDNPEARAQVIQMVQVVHLLWPPFLLAGIARRMQSSANAEVQRILQNARFG